jgi:hypothetical protein
MELPERFKNRQSRREIAGGVVAGLSGGSVPSLSIEGSVFTLIDSSGERQAIETRYIDVVIIDVNVLVPIQRVFYGVGSKYDSSNRNAPLCFSDNGVGASSNAREPQSNNCKTCPMSQWDSAIGLGGKGVPACKSYKKLAVLPLDGDERLYDFPFQLRVPVMSHAALQAYGNKFRDHKYNFDVSDVVTRISFSHGKVGQLEFEARKESPWITDELDGFIDGLLESKITDNLVGRNDVPRQDKLAAPISQPIAQLSSPKKAEKSAADEPAALPPRTRTKKLTSKPAEGAVAPTQEEAKPAPVATARPLPSFLQPAKGASPPESTLTRQPVDPTSETALPSELQAALEAAFNLKV